MTVPSPATQSAKRVLLLGASGTIGQATARALVARGHDTVCLVRPQPARTPRHSPEALARNLEGTTIRACDVTDKASLERDGFCGEAFDVIVSCLASRTGEKKDAQRIDYEANLNALELAPTAGVSHMVLLSAICVQKPKLAFQKAKLAFEDALKGSGIDYSIVRPTAFFKSLTGLVKRVKAGKPYLVFADGELTACKPISDDDLANFIADCLENDAYHNAILPIGGPGEAITPRAQGEYMFSLLGQPPNIKQVPPGLLLGIANALSLVAKAYPPLKARAEYARIGHYYATESMLLLDPETAKYSADLTPSTGKETLFEHLETLLKTDRTPDA
ncbi:MAG: NAD(P)H-binding protein [Henriciella sp.]|uniref:NAD(P)H-binding protein n=1 Tax=Henriciella sp. TaxID=1968823 RepID=UPI003C771D88